MLDLPEVLPAEAEERGAVELRVAAHPVVRVRMELATLGVPPHFFGGVLSFQVHRLRAPVVFLTRHVVAPLYHQDSFARRRKPMRQRATTCSSPDDDDVE